MILKALSLWQPWASAIVCGWKRIETRHWATEYRGLLAIHAAKTRRGLKDYRALLDGYGLVSPAGIPHFGHDELEDLPFGKIVAVVRLVDCVPTERLMDTDLRYLPSRAEQFYGDYGPGRYGWILEDASPLPEPIPYKGTQGLFEIDTEKRHRRYGPQAAA